MEEAFVGFPVMGGGWREWRGCGKPERKDSPGHVTSTPDTRAVRNSRMAGGSKAYAGMLRI